MPAVFLLPEHLYVKGHFIFMCNILVGKAKPKINSLIPVTRKKK